MTLDAFVRSMDNAFAQPMHSQHRTVPNEYGLNDYTTLENRHRRGGDIVEETKVWIAIPIIIFFSIMPISFYDATKKSPVKAYVILSVTALAYICLFYVMHKLKKTDENTDNVKKVYMKLTVLCILGSIIFVCNALQAQPGEADPAPGIGLMLCVFLVLIMVYRMDLLDEDYGMVYALVLISIIVSLILAVCPENDGTKFAAWSLGGILFVGFCYACRTAINTVMTHVLDANPFRNRNSE